MIDRQKDEQYHEMLNSGEMYDSVDDEFIAYQPCERRLYEVSRQLHCQRHRFALRQRRQDVAVLGFTEGTSVRKNPNEFGFSLIYSYLCRRLWIYRVSSHRF